MNPFDVPVTHPYLRTRTGTKLHLGPCEATYYEYGTGQIRHGAVSMTEQQAADWLAADPRRTLCRHCRPPQPHGRLRVVR